MESIKMTEFECANPLEEIVAPTEMQKKRVLQVRGRFFRRGILGRILEDVKKVFASCGYEERDVCDIGEGFTYIENKVYGKEKEVER